MKNGHTELSYSERRDMAKNNLRQVYVDFMGSKIIPKSTKVKAPPKIAVWRLRKYIYEEFGEEFTDNDILEIVTLLHDGTRGNPEFVRGKYHGVKNTLCISGFVQVTLSERNRNNQEKYKEKKAQEKKQSARRFKQDVFDDTLFADKKPEPTYEEMAEYAWFSKEAV